MIGVFVVVVSLVVLKVHPLAHLLVELMAHWNVCWCMSWTSWDV